MSVKTKTNDGADDAVVVQGIVLGQLRPHALNRKFSRTSRAWEDFVQSIYDLGVLAPLVVRPMGDGYEILAGHRRHAALMQIHEGQEMCKAPCLVRAMDDRAALEFLCVENLERENPDPVEEAMLVRAMLREYGMDAAGLSAKINRSVEWVEIRQGLLDLGDEVCDGLRAEVDSPEYVSLGVVQALLAVPASRREEAVQMVLHPGWQVGTLRAREAVQVIHQEILVPMRSQAEWEKCAPKLLKAWRKMLGAAMTKDEAAELIVMAVSWEQWEAGVKVRQPATAKIREELSLTVAEVAMGKTWAQLAVRNGLPVWLLPARGEDGVMQMDAAVPMVDASLLVLAEEARAAHGVESWLAVPAAASGGKVVAPVVPASEEDDEEDDEWTEKNEGPPDERHVRRELGRRVLVDKDLLERVAQLLRESSALRDLTAAEMEELPPVFRRWVEMGGEAHCEGAHAACEWIINGCPMAEGDEA